MRQHSLPRLVRQLRTALDADSLAALSDPDLLALFRRDRDPAAFEAIVHRHGPRVLAACRKVLADPADIDDSFQATFLVLMRHPARVRKPLSLGSWLYGVAHRIALKAIATRQRRTVIESRAKPQVHAAPDLSWREACIILHEELNQLPDTYRHPLMLCYLEGMSRDEAAAQLGRTMLSVKKSLERGREILRKRLTRRGVTLSAGLLAAVAEPVGTPRRAVARHSRARRGSLGPGSRVCPLAGGQILRQALASPQGLTRSGLSARRSAPRPCRRRCTARRCPSWRRV